MFLFIGVMYTNKLKNIVGESLKCKQILKISYSQQRQILGCPKSSFRFIRKW